MLRLRSLVRFASFSSSWTRKTYGSVLLMGTLSLTFLHTACSSSEDEEGSSSTGGASTGGTTSSSGGASTGGGSSATGGIGPGGSGGGGEVIPPDGVPMFVAQGHMGRLTVSCDEGRTWIQNRSDDDAARCFEGGLDCDHGPGAGRGLTYGDGHFFATFGWGEPGKVVRSSDGATWTTVHEGSIFGGLGFADGRLLAGARDSISSPDLGDTWEEPLYTGLSGWNVRRVHSTGGPQNLIVLAGDGIDGSPPEVILTSDGGKTFFKPDELPAGCADQLVPGGLADGNGTLLIVSADGLACSSSDGGKHFVANQIGQAVISTTVWNGTEFMTWGRGMVHRSPDGITWSSQPTVPADLNVVAVAANNDGVIVGILDGWQVWYDKQVFYRSTDGVNWEVADSFVGSHPISHIVFGYASDDTACQQ